MENRREYRFDYRRIVEHSELPHAPMAMPEQVLERAGALGSVLFPLRHWLAWR